MKCETMNLETAADLYGVKLSTLRLLCVKGQIQSQKVGKRRYVTQAEMNRVFKGEVAEAPKAKRSSR